MSMMSANLVVCFVTNNKLVLCLTECQRSYIKWRATRTRTGGNVSFFFPVLTLQTGGAEIAFQVTSCRAIFENGSLPLILEKTIRLPVNRIMKEPLRGSLKARCSRNGKHLDKILFFGYTGNVSTQRSPFSRDS